MSRLPTSFESATEFGAWLAEHGETESELIVGYYKRGSGLPSMSWPESVDAALCIGWIDGVRANIDKQSYKIRFTPRISQEQGSVEILRGATPRLSSPGDLAHHQRQTDRQPGSPSCQTRRGLAKSDTVMKSRCPTALGENND